MNEMNYRYYNPEDQTASKIVDINFAKCFIGKPRNKEKIERFQVYGSMSPAREEIEAMLKYMLIEQKEETIQKVA